MLEYCTYSVQWIELLGSHEQTTMSRVYGSPFTKMANGSFMMCMDNTNCMSLAFQLLGSFEGCVSLAHCNTTIQ